MKIEQYVKSLVTDMDKELLLEEIRITTDELKNVTIPAYKQAKPFFSKWDYKSQRVLNIINIFNTQVKVRKQSFIDTLENGLQNALSSIAEVNRIVNTEFGEDITPLGLTYNKATIMQYVEFLHFASRYARRLLNYIFVAETAEFEGQYAIQDALTPADIEFVESRLSTFVQVFSVISKQPKDLVQAFDEVPKLAITPENIRTAQAISGPTKLDPIRAGFIPVILNPVFHIRMLRAEWQTNRYHQSKQEIKCLQLRKANLEALSNGKPNAKVQKEIDYIEDRVQALMKKNADLEQRYGV